MHYRKHVRTRSRSCAAAPGNKSCGDSVQWWCSLSKKRYSDSSKIPISAIWDHNYTFRKENFDVMLIFWQFWRSDPYKEVACSHLLWLTKIRLNNAFSRGGKGLFVGIFWPLQSYYLMPEGLKRELNIIHKTSCCEFQDGRLVTSRFFTCSEGVVTNSDTTEWDAEFSTVLEEWSNS